MTLPTQMEALVADRHGIPAAEVLAQLRLASLPVPQPAKGRVLVQMLAAPCNPADILYLEGRYGIDRPLPATPGFEGAGVVVASGGGWLGRWLVGKQVVCGGHNCSGTWAQYCEVDANQCVPLKSGLTAEQGSTAMANPMTALALIELIQRGKHRAYVQTGAAGQLGRMILDLASEQSLEGIHIVRRAEQTAVLRERGAKRILVSTEPGFEAALASHCRELNATIALDAVAGPITGQLVKALPRGGEVVVYGALSAEPCGAIDPMTLAFGAKSVRGFELATHLKALGLFGSFRLASVAQKRVAGGKASTQIRARLSLAQGPAGLAEYARSMSDGKVLLTPTPPAAAVV